MRTQCCQPTFGSAQCNDCPLTAPLYRQQEEAMTDRDKPAAETPRTDVSHRCPNCGAFPVSRPGSLERELTALRAENERLANDAMMLAGAILHCPECGGFRCHVLPCGIGDLIHKYAALAQPEGWIPVSERLPELEQVVIVHYPNGYDGSPVYAWGARCDDSEGWLWGVGSGRSGIHPKENADFNDIEVDDDYKVTHWMLLPPAPPAGEGKG